MSRIVGLGPLVGILFATTAACRGPETFRASADSGRPPLTAGVGGASGFGGDDGGGGAAGSAGGAAGSAGEDGGENGSGGSGGPPAEDAAQDTPVGSGGSSGTGGQDAGPDLAAGSGGSGGQDAGRDLPAEMVPPACASTTDCPCLTYGGHAYRFCRAGRAHSAAITACVAHGMRLVRIDSNAENQWLYSTKVAQNFMSTWIGANDVGTEGDWRWPDNTAFWTGVGMLQGGAPVNNLYNAWETGAGEPNQNGNEDCAGYWYMNDRWADLTCSDVYSYICESY